MSSQSDIMCETYKASPHRGSDRAHGTEGMTSMQAQHIDWHRALEGCEQVFWSKVAVGADEECWPWTAAITKTRGGYGIYSFFVGNVSRTFRTHRAAWELTFGPIPNGLLVCHHCDNPPCCNPSHLFLGTVKDNATDMLLKGRHGTTTFPKENVEELRALYAAGASFRELSRRFGISYPWAREIALGRRRTILT